MKNRYKILAVSTKTFTFVSKMEKLGFESPDDPYVKFDWKYAIIDMLQLRWDIYANVFAGASVIPCTAIDGGYRSDIDGYLKPISMKHLTKWVSLNPKAFETKKLSNVYGI